MARLLSGKVKVTPYAGLSTDRYEFIQLSETEPNAGLPGVDGYVLARLAHLAGYRTIVLQIGDVAKLKGDALTAYEAMNQVGLYVQEFTDKKLKIVDVVVDVEVVVIVFPN